MNKRLKQLEKHVEFGIATTSFQNLAITSLATDTE